MDNIDCEFCGDVACLDWVVDHIHGLCTSQRAAALLRDFSLWFDDNVFKLAYLYIMVR